MASGNYYGFYDYWELYHKVTFDGVNKLVLINNGETDLNIQIDLYSAWKEWLLLEDNMKYFQAINTVGGEPTIGDERLDVTYFLINGWKIKPYPGSYDLVLTGNIFDVDGGSIKVQADVVDESANNISINTNTSVIVRQITTEVSSSGGGIFDPETIVSASLFGVQETSLYNIENRVISIENILSNPVTASLVPTQLAQLTNIENLATSQSIQLTSLTETNASQSAALIALQTKLFEVWQLHGLDTDNPLTVNQTSRTFGDVAQSIITTGTGSLQLISDSTTLTMPGGSGTIATEGFGIALAVALG